MQLAQGIKCSELNLCPINVLPQANTIHQTSKDTYIMAASDPTTITQRTQKQVQKINSGTYQIQVDPNCTTSSDQWVVYPTLQIEDVNVKTATVQYVFDIPTIHDNLNNEELKRPLIQAVNRLLP